MRPPIRAGRPCTERLMYACGVSRQFDNIGSRYMPLRTVATPNTSPTPRHAHGGSWVAAIAPDVIPPTSKEPWRISNLRGLW